MVKKIKKPNWAGQRFSHTSAIAPNASSSIIMGNTSPSIEPYRANAYRQDTLSGAWLNKNKWLDKIIMEKCDADSKLDYNEIMDDVWLSEVKYPFMADVVHYFTKIPLSACYDSTG